MAATTNWWYSDSTTTGASVYFDNSTSTSITYDPNSCTIGSASRLSNIPHSNQNIQERIINVPEFSDKYVVTIDYWQLGVRDDCSRLSFTVKNMLELIDRAYDQGFFGGFFNNAPVGVIKRLFYMSCYMLQKEGSESAALYIKVIVSLLKEWGYNIWA